jgi:predicted Rossmann-fold nucleotide-binding protein
MTSVSRGFTQAPRRHGICIGILPSLSRDDRATPKPGYPNPFIELAIYTHLPLSGDRGREDGSRNHINVLSSDGLIALPGGHGTLSEVALALEYRKPVIAYARDALALRVFPASVRRTSQLTDVEAFVRNLLP